MKLVKLVLRYHHSILPLIKSNFNQFTKPDDQQKINFLHKTIRAITNDFIGAYYTLFLMLAPPRGALFSYSSSFLIAVSNP